MHVDRRFVFVVMASLVWGVVVSGLFYRMASAGRNQPPQKTLVLAARALSPGAAIVAEEVRMVRVPQDAFPKGGFSRAEEVIGRPVISSIGLDEPVLESRLAARGSGFGVAPMIPAGMRAASVRVNDVVGVAGFVLPGMRVDVLVTGKPQGSDDTFTTTVLQNVTVLSAGQRVEVDGKSQSMSVTVVTLLVDPVQAESLTLAASEGHIQLVLRNSNDQNVAETAGRHWRDLYQHAASPEMPPAPPVRVAERRRPAPPPPVVVSPVTSQPVETVVLIRGSQKTIETFPPEPKEHEALK